LLDGGEFKNDSKIDGASDMIQVSLLDGGEFKTDSKIDDISDMMRVSLLNAADSELTAR